MIYLLIYKKPLGGRERKNYPHQSGDRHVRSQRRNRQKITYLPQNKKNDPGRLVPGHLQEQINSLQV